MLKIDHLSASYKTIDCNVHVVKDVDFEINDNEIFGIAGESGCGKSTLLKTLYDIIEFPLEIDSGKVILSGEKNGRPFSYESGQIRKSWWNNISYVPQAAQSVLNPIVRLKSQFLDSIPKEDRKNETEKQTLDRVGKYLEELGLSRDVLEAFPFQLSGGMRQRAIIALATFMSCLLYTSSNENKLQASSNHYAQFAEIRGIVAWILQESFLLLSFQSPLLYPSFGSQNELCDRNSYSEIYAQMEKNFFDILSTGVDKR